MPTDDLSHRVLQHLNALVALSVCQLLTTREPKDLVGPLARAGLPPKTIAELLGVNPVTVRTALHRARQSRRAPRSRSRTSRS
jgi:hypothetical protein